MNAFVPLPETIVGSDLMENPIYMHAYIIARSAADWLLVIGCISLLVVYPRMPHI